MADHLLSAAELLAPDKCSKVSPEWFEQNIVNPAINAGPLGVYNTAAALANLPELHLKTDDAGKVPYSTEWLVQGLSGGAGAVVPLALMSVGTGSLMQAANRNFVVGTAWEGSLNPLLTSQKTAMIAGASLYGALQKPDANHTRLGNAIGMGAGLAMFMTGNQLVKELPVLQKAVAYPLIGFVGGGAMSELSQLASNFNFAAPDKALQSAIQGMALNTVMGLGADYISKRPQAQLSEKTSGTDLPGSNKRSIANVDFSSKTLDLKTTEQIKIGEAAKFSTPAETSATDSFKMPELSESLRSKAQFYEYETEIGLAEAYKQAADLVEAHKGPLDAAALLDISKQLKGLSTYYEYHSETELSYGFTSAAERVEMELQELSTPGVVSPEHGQNH